MPRLLWPQLKLRLQRLRPRTLFSTTSAQREDHTTTLGGRPRRFDLGLRLVLSQASLCLFRLVARILLGLHEPRAEIRLLSIRGTAKTALDPDRYSKSRPDAGARLTDGTKPC